MAQSVNMVLFLGSFRVSAPQGIIMSTRLLQRADKEAPEAVRHAQENIRRVCAKLDDEYTARGATRKAPQIRNTVAAMANGWRSISTRFQAWTTLPGEALAESVEAQNILDDVLPNGLDFLVGDPGVQWIESRRRLTILTAPENIETVTRLAGAQFVTVLRNVHRAVGVELGLVGDATRECDEQDYRPLVKELVEVIRDYALQVIAADKASGASDPAHVAYLLEPIETNRMRPSGDSSEEDEQDDPVPAPAPAPQPDVVRDARPANDAAQPAAGERRVA